MNALNNKALTAVLVLFFAGMGLCEDTIVNVMVPLRSKFEAKKSWRPPIDSLLNAGDTVVFIGSDSTPFNVPYIQLLEDSTLYFKTTSGAIDSMKLVPGFWHQQWVNTIYPSSSGAGIRVKIVKEP